MINQKKFILSIILFGLFLTLPLASAKLTFPINFRNIFSVDSKIASSPAPLLSNDGLKIDNSMGQIAFWDEYNNLTGDDALFWDNDAKMLGIGTNGYPTSPLHVISNNFYRSMTIENFMDSGMGIKVKSEANSGSQYGINIATKTGINGHTAGSAYGLVSQATGSGGTSKTYGIFVRARDGGTNWAGYFAEGNVKIEDNLEIGNNTFFVDSVNDNVGIGTFDPSAKLEIVGVDNTFLRFQQQGQPEDYSTSFGFMNDNQLSMDTYIKNPCGKGMGCDLILDFPFGNVGISTTKPSYKLDVTGKVHASEGFKLPIIDYGDVGVCDESQEGLVLIKKQDGANLSYRKVIICMQTGDDSFSWESLLSTSWGAYASEKEYNSGSSLSE